MLPIKVFPPERQLELIAARAKAQRLEQNLSRRSLASKSGVPEGTIKHFEQTGSISLGALVRLAIALDCQESLDHLFETKPVASIQDLPAKPRQRGRE